MSKTANPELLDAFDFSIPLQIRFSDIDGYQHVNNGVYFNYYEHSRAVFLSDVCDWNVMEIGVVVAKIDIDYFRPIHLQDTVSAYVRCSKIGNSSFVLEQILAGKAAGGEEVIFSKSNCTMVSVDMKTMKPVSVPEAYRLKLGA
ncbi:acyl-CoA thioesterase [Algoriphagus machipongonensis]|uniref:Esterase n=1 Tax=Algoriphagus machipongonensis TaxID=388413 RepID=A3HYI0_9BACT|nr:thioesterase family protein [Algoriphagus machipongonensis]EAZ80316.1 esterase [Algoriphagus machipongonensis]